MDKYIQELLAKNKSVILPDFGALTITDEETGEIMFNEYVRFNDGKLEAFIAEQEGIEKQDAANTIAKYVRDLELLLNKGETYDIFQFGRFIKQVDGSYDFENWNAFSEDGSSTYRAPQKEELIPQDSKTDETPVKKELLREEESEKPTEVYEKPVERTLPKEEKKQPQNKFTPKDTAPSDKSKTEKTKKPAEKKIDKKEKKKRKVWVLPLILFLVILGGAGIFIGLFPDKAKALVGWEDTTNTSITSDASDKQNQENLTSDEDIDSEELNLEESNSSETELNEDEITDQITEGLTESTSDNQQVEQQEELTPDPQTPPASNGNYHIIVGSFTNPSNAQNFATSLQSKGYSASVIGPINTYHMVSFGSYPSQKEAMNNLDKATSETGGGWILKR